MNSKHLANGFYESSLRYSDRPALSIDGQEVSYGQLAHFAQGLSQQLQAECQNDDVHLTAVFGQRSQTTYAGILAALFAGHGYVPLNPDFPINRLQGMLERSQCRSMIVDKHALSSLADLLDGGCQPLLVILPDNLQLLELRERYPQHLFRSATDVSSSQVRKPCQLGHTAYLLFTSGSTGIPKGVKVSHENVCHFLQSAQARYQLSYKDRVSQTFALTFDLSVFDLFLAWGAGACICVPSAKELMKPGKYINREQLTLWFSVPSTALFMKTFGELKPDKYTTLHWSLFCGEALPVELANHWSLAAPNSVVENLYGPTELTIACTVHRFRSDDRLQYGEGGNKSNLVPIGEPLPGMQAMIVDENFEKVAVGTQGELMMTGPQLTAGYLNDLEKTGESFIHLPDHNETYYRTGDSVIRRTAKAPIEYIGRLDNQIQINGHRVELGEIESIIRSVGKVDEAVAVGWPQTENGIGGVVVFVQAPKFDRKLIFANLKSHLPNYMTPSRIEVVERFPINSNGKIDRNALIELLAETQK
ncbi:MAG: amino acid adenylation domain-containing protein [Pirellulales bacterium]